MKQAIRSVLAQTFQDWRLVVVVVVIGYPDPEPPRRPARIDAVRSVPAASELTSVVGPSV